MKTLFLLLLLTPAFCFGQQKSKDNNFILKMNATSLIDVFSFPTLQPSFEAKIHRDISLTGELGYQFYHVPRADTTFTNTTGLKANVEIRLYNIFSKVLKLKRHEKSLDGEYLGINLFYRRNRYNASIDYTRAAGMLHYNDCFTVDKNNRGANLVAGYQGSLSKKLILDVYAGLGYMKLNLSNTHREIKDEDTISGTDLVPLFASWNLSETSGWRVNVNFGIRLGIKL